MILILSFRHYEQGTDPVIDWLFEKGANFKRISSQDLLDKRHQYNLNVVEGTLSLNSMKVDLNEVKVIWDRRWQDSGLILDEYPEREWPYEQLIYEHDNEIRYLSGYLFDYLRNRTWLGDPFKSENKLTMLAQAANAGLEVPRSSVINNKADLRHFFTLCNNSIVSKPIHHSHYFEEKDFVYSIYTNSFDSLEAIERLPDNFFPTLFQEKVPGDLEVRTFYLDGEFYSMAILTNKQARSETDIKLSFGEETTRWVPYKLPDALEAKLDNMMRATGSNTGSIDIIKDRNDTFYFIENNPCGQYSAPGYRGNFYLEEKIADWLIANDK